MPNHEAARLLRAVGLPVIEIRPVASETDREAEIPPAIVDNATRVRVDAIRGDMTGITIPWRVDRNRVNNGRMAIAAVVTVGMATIPGVAMMPGMAMMPVRNELNRRGVSR